MSEFKRMLNPEPHNYFNRVYTVDILGLIDMINLYVDFNIPVTDPYSIQVQDLEQIEACKTFKCDHPELDSYFKELFIYSVKNEGCIDNTDYWFYQYGHNLREIIFCSESQSISVDTPAEKLIIDEDFDVEIEVKDSITCSLDNLILFLFLFDFDKFFNGADPNLDIEKIDTIIIRNYQDQKEVVVDIGSQLKEKIKKIS